MKFNLKLLLNGLFQLELLGLMSYDSCNLSWSSLGDVRYTNLLTLHFFRCDTIGNQTFLTIAEYMASLIELNLRHAKQLTDYAFEIIMRKLNNLKIFRLHGCQEITDNSMQTINTYGINIEELVIFC